MKVIRNFLLKQSAEPDEVTIIKAGCYVGKGRIFLLNRVIRNSEETETYFDIF